MPWFCITLPHRGSHQLHHGPHVEQVTPAFWVNTTYWFTYTIMPILGPQFVHWQRRVQHQFRLCHCKCGVSSKSISHSEVIVLIHCCVLEANMGPSFMMTGNVFTSQSTGLGGETVSASAVQPQCKQLLPTSDGESPGHWWMETVAGAFCWQSSRAWYGFY